MKFWIDECLTPALVGCANSLGYEATCTRDRGRLGMPDDELLGLAQFLLFSDAIAHILHRANQDQEASGDWMLNRVVEVDEQSGEVRDAPIPDS